MVAASTLHVAAAGAVGSHTVAYLCQPLHCSCRAATSLRSALHDKCAQPMLGLQPPEAKGSTSVTGPHQQQRRRVGICPHCLQCAWAFVGRLSAMQGCSMPLSHFDGRVHTAESATRQGYPQLQHLYTVQVLVLCTVAVEEHIRQANPLGSNVFGI
jgi:hypothetical protein